MGGTCSTTGKDENRLKNLDRENGKEETVWEAKDLCLFTCV
jgi:hypothetical protein